MITVSERPAEKNISGEATALAAAARRKRLLVVDDHPAVRMGLRRLLEEQPDFVLVDVVASAEAAVSVAEHEEIDVAVVDYQLGTRSGLWASRKLKGLPNPPRVVIYSAYADGVLAAACVIAEADGLVSKGGVGAELCEAIRAVARGRLLLPIVPQPLAAVMRGMLDAQEQAIFGLLLAGLAPVDVARALGVPDAGLDSQLWAMLHKLETLYADPGQARAARIPINAGRLIGRRQVGVN